MDCEMVGVGRDGAVSALARVSIVNEFGHPIYDKFVSPWEEVTDYRTAFSGIRPSDLVDAPQFTQVQAEVAEILKDRIVVGHDLSHDFQALLLEHPQKLIRDTSKYKPFIEAFGNRTPSLKNLAAKFLGLGIQSGEHSSVEDAHAAVGLYKMHSTKWEESLMLEESLRFEAASEANLTVPQGHSQPKLGGEGDNTTLGLIAFFLTWIVNGVLCILEMMVYFFTTYYCPICRKVFDNNNMSANKHNMEIHYQTHYMDCPKCDWRIWSRSGNKDALREGLAKHMAEPHDVSVTCPICHKVFNSCSSKRANQNCMEQHQQVHRQNTHQCPLCGVQRFRSQASAVQHVESGACPNCRGRETARNGVYNFIATNPETRHMLSEQPRLLYNGYGVTYDIPDLPYKCDKSQCIRKNKRFKTAGMMQHQMDVHSIVNRRLALR